MIYKKNPVDTKTGNPLKCGMAKKTESVRKDYNFKSIGLKGDLKALIISEAKKHKMQVYDYIEQIFSFAMKSKFKPEKKSENG